VPRASQRRMPPGLEPPGIANPLLQGRIAEDA